MKKLYILLHLQYDNMYHHYQRVSKVSYDEKPLKKAVEIIRDNHQIAPPFPVELLIDYPDHLAFRIDYGNHYVVNEYKIVEQQF